MYEDLQAQVKEAHAGLRAAHEVALAALGELREQYRQVWVTWKAAGSWAGREFSKTTISESDAVLAEMRRIADIVYGSQPDADISRRLGELIRLDQVLSETLNG